MKIDYSGKTVVVIGATSGINKGIAETFAKLGARLVVASRTQSKVDDTVVSIRNSGAECEGFVADVRDFDALNAGFSNLPDAYKPFDILISGAAGNFPAFAEDMSVNGFKSVVDIDLMGTFHVMKAAHAHLVKPGASIINISAPQAYLPMQAQAHVCAAKAGVDMITQCLAMEWGDKGIRVNSVVPGPIAETEGMRRLAPTPEYEHHAAESVPLKRLGTVSDVGNLCAYICSEYAQYITGAVIPVDGGWSLGGASGVANSLAEIIKG